MNTNTNLTPSSFDLVVTRHPGLAAWLMREGLIDASTPVIEHAAPADVRGLHVMGVLPHHLSALAASITEVQLDIPRDMRGIELSADQVAAFARGMHTYKVRRSCAEHAHSAAVEAAWRYVERYGTSFGAGPGILTYVDRTHLGLRVTVIGSGCEQASAEIITSRGVWRPCKGPWLDGLGREVASIEPASGWGWRLEAVKGFELAPEVAALVFEAEEQAWATAFKLIRGPEAEGPQGVEALVSVVHR
jgi:putative CRISPR-associated protein (TIGR02620 family)